MIKKFLTFVFIWFSLSLTSAAIQERRLTFSQLLLNSITEPDNKKLKELLSDIVNIDIFKTDINIDIWSGTYYGGISYFMQAIELCCKSFNENHSSKNERLKTVELLLAQRPNDIRFAISYSIEKSCFELFELLFKEIDTDFIDYSLLSEIINQLYKTTKDSVKYNNLILISKLILSHPHLEFNSFYVATLLTFPEIDVSTIEIKKLINALFNPYLFDKKVFESLYEKLSERLKELSKENYTKILLLFQLKKQLDEKTYIDLMLKRPDLMEL